MRRKVRMVILWLVTWFYDTYILMLHMKAFISISACAWISYSMEWSQWDSLVDFGWFFGCWSYKIVTFIDLLCSKVRLNEWLSSSLLQMLLCMCIYMPKFVEWMAVCMFVLYVTFVTGFFSLRLGWINGCQNHCSIWNVS